MPNSTIMLIRPIGPTRTPFRKKKSPIVDSKARPSQVPVYYYSTRTSLRGVPSNKLSIFPDKLANFQRSQFYSWNIPYAHNPTHLHDDDGIGKQAERFHRPSVVSRRDVNLSLWKRKQVRDHLGRPVRCWNLMPNCLLPPVVTARGLSFATTIR